jgi:DNA polymerase III delta prime subunit
MFKKATKSQAKARLLFSGASGSGKTTAALTVAAELGKRIAFIDTEAGSASLYADRFDFDVLELSPPYAPERFIEAIEAAEQAGYEVIVIDSITHEWSGPGGCLDIKTKMGDRFQDWAKVTPRHDRFIQAMMRSKAHIIATVRAKQGYSMDEKGKVQKSGMDPQQRDGIDFEFTVCWNINAAHMAEAQKDRTRLFDGKPEIITAETGERLAKWLSAGEAPAPVAEAQPVDLKTTIRQHKLAKKLVPTLLAKLNKANLDECDDGELNRIKTYLEAKEVEA